MYSKKFASYRNAGRNKGIAAVLLSAVIFGFTPIIAKLAQNGGANGMTLTFLRGAFAIPVLHVILKKKKISLKLSWCEARAFFVFGGLGMTLTTLTLYSSYEFISVGMATVFHYIYPVFVVVGCTLIFRERIRKYCILALILSISGVVLCSDPGQGAGQRWGIVLSLASGVFYAIYMIGAEKTGLKKMHFLKVSYYLCITSTVFSGLIGIFTRNFILELTPKAWIYSFIVSILVSVGAITFLQIGIREIGASASSVLSTMEPITSVVLGVLILNEALTISKILGCIFILSSILLILHTGDTNG